MIRQEAHAKINLSLDVLGRRADGYHEVRMIMQGLKLCDEVFLEELPEAEGIVLEPFNEESRREDIPYDARNLMYRAALLMREQCGVRDGVRLRLLKRIPAAAGLAGGSADAAAVLRGMNDLFSLHLSEARLSELGLKIGADVPYCLMGGTALAEGIGEVLTPLSPAPACGVLLVKPARGVSTGEVYRALSIENRPKSAHPDIDGVCSALQDKNIRRLCSLMGNILELVTEPMVPEITEIKAALLHKGAMGALMSGSGPTVFGIFTDRKLLSEAAEYFRSGASGIALSDVIETEFMRITAL